MAVKRAIFLDKDGTLVPDVPFNVEPEKITLSGEMLEGLKTLHDAGFQLFVISNQSGIARGYYERTAMLAVETKIQQLLKRESIYLDGFYFCPHHPDGDVAAYSISCNCRKPQPGLILEAAHDHDIDLEKSWMIGDILDDIEAGHRAGCRAILINNGNETEWEMSDLRVPDVMVRTINEATAYILNQKASIYENDERISAAHRKV